MYRDWNPSPLYKCQGQLLQSEALPILSPSSRKDESIAVFCVSIGLQVWIMEAILSNCMAHANGTCHVSFRGCPYIYSTTFPSFPCVELRRFGPNRIRRSAAMTKFIKSCARCHRHVPSGRKHIAINPIQYRRAKNINALASTEGFCLKISSGGSLEKSSRADVCVYVLVVPVSDNNLSSDVREVRQISVQKLFEVWVCPKNS